MKRINQSTGNPYRCGDVDPDTGMIFRAFNKARVRKDGTYVELWLTPESFNRIRERMKLDARARRQRDAFKRTKTTRELIDALDTAPHKASSGGLHNGSL